MFYRSHMTHLSDSRRKQRPVAVTDCSGLRMEELHDVQLTEIKPLLTGQVSSPGLQFGLKFVVILWGGINTYMYIYCFVCMHAIK